MKVVAKPIDTIVVFKGKNHPMPYKFRYTDDFGESREIYVGKVIHVDKLRLAGVDSLVYECQSSVDDCDTRYQLKYYIQSCSWQLYKI